MYRPKNENIPRIYFTEAASPLTVAVSYVDSE